MKTFDDYEGGAGWIWPLVALMGMGMFCATALGLGYLYLTTAPLPGPNVPTPTPAVDARAPLTAPSAAYADHAAQAKTLFAGVPEYSRRAAATLWGLAIAVDRTRNTPVGLKHFIEAQDLAGRIQFAGDPDADGTRSRALIESVRDEIGAEPEPFTPARRDALIKTLRAQAWGCLQASGG